MNLPPYFMVFDVESVGLHGEGFAVGYVVVDATGHELDSNRMACRPGLAIGSQSGREWIAANIPPIEPSYPDHLPPEIAANYEFTPMRVRSGFWEAWMSWKKKGAVLVADCAWPVEARFLIACVDDDPKIREWQGPYPLYDLASIRTAASLDPLGTEDRLPDELPVHDPLADARQSARLLIEAIKRIQESR